MTLGKNLMFTNIKVIKYVRQEAESGVLYFSN